MAISSTTKKFQKYFPFLPQHSSWEDFNGNLIMYYGQELIPYTTEDDWQHTANGMAQSATFSSYPLPNPAVYNTWQDWAAEFVLIVNGSPKK